MIGDDSLRRRVAGRCGQASEIFAPYGHRFGRWLDAEPGVRHDRELEEVRTAVAGYLGDAFREGRRWGTAIGVALGVAGAIVSFLLVWAVS